eukprot:13095679-Alexandrium_andersonii.AAC.1
MPELAVQDWREGVQRIDRNHWWYFDDMANAVHRRTDMNGPPSSSSAGPLISLIGRPTCSGTGASRASRSTLGHCHL